MLHRIALIALPLLLSACAAPMAMQNGGSAPAPAAPVDVKIIAINDFHGNLEPPKLAISATDPSGAPIRVPAGGAAWLASAIATLKAQNPHHAVVSAGDMIGASPLTSALFLDEPTIYAMNRIGVDFNAVGNHEFDKGREELLRMQNGGCAVHTARTPCAIDPDFPGAKFRMLAANTMIEDGKTLFAPTGLKSFGPKGSDVQVGFIGLTLRTTDALVTPAGIKGIRFADEAETANALIPGLKAQGADAIVVVIHQGANSSGSYNSKDCSGLEGDLIEILNRLDPAVDVVVSGHTHQAYICDYGTRNPARPFLVTSAGQYGTLVSDIRLTIDPVKGAVTAKSADNLIVQSEGFVSPRETVTPSSAFPAYAPDAEVAALVARYADAASASKAKVIGRLRGPADRVRDKAGQSVLGNLVADAQLAATRAPEAGGAQIALMNAGGLRADLVPLANDDVTFGSIFSAQPFGNALLTQTLTGAQLKAVLEQQFATSEFGVRMLFVSQGFSYSFDASKPAGARIADMMLNGQPIRMDQDYRVTTSSFLASGGDYFTTLKAGRNPQTGPLDIEALQAYLSGPELITVPALGRVRGELPQ